jgi:hypothetical protein
VISTVALFTSNTSNFSRNILQDFSTPILSTVQGLGTTGYASTSYVIQQISSFSTSLGSVGGGTGNITTANITSTVQGLGTTGYASTSYVIQQISSFSTSLGQLGGGTGNLTTANLTSTVQGLGNIYLSSGGGGTGNITTANVISTVDGLGTANYVSTSFLTQQISSFSTSLGSLGGGGGGSGNITTANITSTVGGLGTTGYVSSLQIFSTVTGITLFVSSFYIDIPELTSTVSGLLMPRPVTYFDF